MTTPHRNARAAAGPRGSPRGADEFDASENGPTSRIDIAKQSKIRTGWAGRTVEGLGMALSTEKVLRRS